MKMEMRARQSTATSRSFWGLALIVTTLLAAFGSSALADLTIPAAPAPAVTAAPTTGLYPLAGDAPVPLEWMPPGSDVSPVPSDEVFPPQTITIRFNHKKHVGDMGLSCKVCHAGAYASSASSDRLLPKPAATCDNCHDVSHQNLAKVEAGTEPNGQCTYCHLGDAAGRNGRVARFVLPSPNLRFDHKAHLDRNIGCAQCHGQIEKLELATRDQLPRMAGCFSCHAQPPPSDGEARGACTNCHITEPSGQLVTAFATGRLMPPDWLHMSGHTPDWLTRHRTVAASDSQFCGSCHKEDDCASCHDGKVRNRNVHPNDWISMHAEGARQDSPRCTSCHQLQTFCADCHRRVGVARDGPVGARGVSERFHPPPSVWTTAPRGAGHHAWEAQRNLNACVSCHAERDCATCHATRGIGGGQGVNPHPSGFGSGCKSALDRNPRPCLVCHERNDGALARCR